MIFPDLRERLCDSCLAFVEAEERRNPDYGILHPDLCPRCQAKMLSWVGDILSQLEAAGAPIPDLRNE